MNQLLYYLFWKTEALLSVKCINVVVYLVIGDYNTQSRNSWQGNWFYILRRKLVAFSEREFLDYILLPTSAWSIIHHHVATDTILEEKSK